MRPLLRAVQSFSEDALTVCPECDGRLRKLFNAVGVVFKGSGFYRTDSRSASSSSTPAASGGSSSDSSSSSLLLQRLLLDLLVRLVSSSSSTSSCRPTDPAPCGGARRAPGDPAYRRGCSRDSRRPAAGCAPYATSFRRRRRLIAAGLAAGAAAAALHALAPPPDPSVEVLVAAGTCRPARRSRRTTSSPCVPRGARPGGGARGPVPVGSWPRRWRRARC